MIKIIGIGNSLRRDDGAGPAAVALLRPQLPTTVALLQSGGEAIALMAQWTTSDHVILIDALRGRRPGEILRLEADQTAALIQPERAISTHGFGVAAAVEFARLLQLLPQTLVIYAVAGAEFGYGEGVCEAVAAALPVLVAQVAEEVRQLSKERDGKLSR